MSEPVVLEGAVPPGLTRACVDLVARLSGLPVTSELTWSRPRSLLDGVAPTPGIGRVTVTAVSRVVLGSDPGRAVVLVERDDDRVIVTLRSPDPLVTSRDTPAAILRPVIEDDGSPRFVGWGVFSPREVEAVEWELGRYAGEGPEHASNESVAELTRRVHELPRGDVGLLVDALGSVAEVPVLSVETGEAPALVGDGRVVARHLEALRSRDLGAPAEWAFRRLGPVTS